jgi:hypothetical protein
MKQRSDPAGLKVGKGEQHREIINEEIVMSYLMKNQQIIEL